MPKQIDQGDEPPASEKMFPKWTLEVQEFWMDTFENMYQLLLEQNPDEDSDLLTRKEFPVITEKQLTYLEDKVKVAARLSDLATVEMLYRFERQRPNRTTPKERRKQSRGRDRDDRNPSKRKARPSRW